MICDARNSWHLRPPSISSSVHHFHPVRVNFAEQTAAILLCSQPRGWRSLGFLSLISSIIQVFLSWCELWDDDVTTGRKRFRRVVEDVNQFQQNDPSCVFKYMFGKYGLNYSYLFIDAIFIYPAWMNISYVSIAARQGEQMTSHLHMPDVFKCVQIPRF